MSDKEVSDSKRLFIAVDMPQTVIDEIIRIQSYLKKGDLFRGSYTRADSSHITIKFLGNVLDKIIPEIDLKLRGIQFPKMHAQLCNVDVFVARSHIKILYLNVMCPQLAELAKQLDTALTSWYDSEKRPFVAHITLARIKDIHDSEQLLEEIKRFQVNNLEFLIDHFVLKQSVLTPQGSEYTDVASYKFK